MKTKKELVLEILGEGGGWNIYRAISPDGSIRFSQERCGGSFFDADDLDMTEEEFKALMEKLNAPVFYETFESFWQEFTKHRLEYHLFYRNIHPDYLEIMHKTFIDERKNIPEDELRRFDKCYTDAFESPKR